jgi:CBS domain-containing protein
MLVREIMTSPAVSISSAASVDHAARTLRTRGFTALPVLDDDGRLIGIITEADVLEGRVEPDERRRHPELPRRPRPGDTVVDVMTSPVESLTPGADVADAAQMMLDERIRCIPVVDGRAVVGVITRRDLLGVIDSDRPGAKHDAPSRVDRGGA